MNWNFFKPDFSTSEAIWVLFCCVGLLIIGSVLL